ncbi:hypothetical protein VZT92_009228 [Zoarces viviparus]|uniref:Uncharacterized protein n=1 Tax=Zoarces viviparus TaxID=48416 RepID=A0AAW1FH62_ZOAVI
MYVSNPLENKNAEEEQYPSSRCPRRARCGLLRGMPAALEEEERTAAAAAAAAAAALWSTDALRDARTPLPSNARRTKQQRRRAAARLCCQKPKKGRPPTPPPPIMRDSSVDQSQAVWVDRLSAESQWRGGAGRGEDR